MRSKAPVLIAFLAAAVAGPSSLAAQRAWKPMMIIDKPARAVLPTLSVDTQRVVREADGTYSVSLRWSPGADAKLAPRTDRIERHRLDCRGRRTTSIAAYFVPVREGKDSTLVSFADSEVTSLGFESGAPEREFFEAVCQWVQKAVPGSE